MGAAWALSLLVLSGCETQSKAAENSSVRSANSSSKPRSDQAQKGAENPPSQAGSPKGQDRATTKNAPLREGAHKRDAQGHREQGADAKAPSAAPGGPPRDGPRIYALSRNVWVRGAPTSDVQWIGFLWLGGSVKIRGDQRMPGAGCQGEWTPIEPRGWVCVDGEKVTTDPEDPMLKLLYPLRPRVDTPWPHRYAAVHAPLRRYLALPDEKTQKVRERGYERHMEQVRAARKTGDTSGFADHLGEVTVALTGKQPPPFPLLGNGLPDLPPGLSEHRTKMVGRSAFAYTAEADFQDRAFLLAADMSWVPRDRVELLEPIEFQGVELGKDFSLPIALFKGHDRPAHRLTQAGRFEEVPRHFKRHSAVKLTGKTKTSDDTVYYAVEGSELWVSEHEAVIPTPREKTPWGTKVGEPDRQGLHPKGRATWMEASVLGGWLLAYEGTTPVYATLISAGRGGTPHKGRPPLETASTPTGRFPITGKFKTATMESSSTPIVHADVPWTQNFSGPHALHGAYWHDDWGDLKSAGCVNVSPRDGKWLFEFTEPTVPQGWHGVRYLSRYGPATLFVIHE